MKVTNNIKNTILFCFVTIIILFFSSGCDSIPEPNDLCQSLLVSCVEIEEQYEKHRDSLRNSYFIKLFLEGREKPITIDAGLKYSIAKIVKTGK